MAQDPIRDHSSATSGHQGRNPGLVRIRTSSIPDRGRQVTIKAGRSRVEHHVPPAGEKFAFDVRVYEHEITVYVSSTGRSVRVWIDHDEIPVPKKPRSHS